MKILSISGFVPEQIVDVVRFTSYPGTDNISHYCGYVSDFMSQVMHDASVDGAVFPKSCDSSRVIESYLLENDKFLFCLDIPARQDEMAISYYAKVINNYKNSLEKYFQVKITDIENRIELVNERNKALRKIYDDITDISYYDYLKSIHELLQLPLEEQRINTNFDKKQNSKKKVYIVGSFLSNTEVIKIIEECDLAIVGDNLTESKRLISMPQVSMNGNLYENIATSILKNCLSPTQNNFKDILKCDLEEICKKSVDGVIFVHQKYCEPYEYLYSVYKKRLDEKGIPCLKISLLDSEDKQKVRLAVEAFADSL